MGLIQLAYSSGRDRDLRWRVEEAVAVGGKRFLSLRTGSGSNDPHIAWRRRMKTMTPLAITGASIANREPVRVTLVETMRVGLCSSV